MKIHCTDDTKADLDDVQIDGGRVGNVGEAVCLLEDTVGVVESSASRGAQTQLLALRDSLVGTRTYIRNK